MKTKEMLSRILGDEHKLCLLSEMIDELLEDSEEPKKYECSLHMITYGPHHTEDTLKKSGVPIKYSYPEIQRVMTSSGIMFDECITPEDIVYTVNSLYKTYYPLIPDLSHALKFTDKYLHEEYPVKNGRAFMEWKNKNV